MFINPNPECTDECAFSTGPSMVTAMYFTPVYDKHGNNLNPDRNWHTTEVSCHKCSTSWRVRTNGEQTEITKI